MPDENTDPQLDSADLPHAAGRRETNTPEEVAAFDLDGDGKISTIEAERARLGVVDARLEEIAEEGGVKGAIADALHKVVDRLDNDD